MGKTNGTAEPLTVVVRDRLYEVPGVSAEAGRSYRISRAEDFLDPAYWRRGFEGSIVDVRQGASRYVQDILTLRHLQPEIQNPLQRLLENYTRSFRTSDPDKRIALWMADRGNGLTLSEPVEWRDEAALNLNVESALEVMGLARREEDSSIIKLALVLVFSVAVTVRAITVAALRNAVRAVTAGGDDRFRGAQFQILHITPFEDSILRGRVTPAIDNALIFRAGVAIDDSVASTSGPHAAPSSSAPPAPSSPPTTPAASGSGAASASATDDIASWDMSSFVITDADETIIEATDEDWADEAADDGYENAGDASEDDISTAELGWAAFSGEAVGMGVALP